MKKYLFSVYMRYIDRCFKLLSQFTPAEASNSNGAMMEAFRILSTASQINRENSCILA